MKQLKRGISMVEVVISLTIIIVISAAMLTAVMSSSKISMRALERQTAVIEAKNLYEIFCGGTTDFFAVSDDYIVGRGGEMSAVSLADIPEHADIFSDCDTLYMVSSRRHYIYIGFDDDGLNYHALLCFTVDGIKDITYGVNEVSSS